MDSILTKENKRMNTQDRYLTLKQVREMFTVSRSTIWRWQSERGLRVVTIGGVKRVREYDLQKFLGKHEQPSAQCTRALVMGCDLN